MSNYRLIYQDKAHEFHSEAEAQDFLDNLSSRAGVEIVEAPLLFQLLNALGAPFFNWREINKEICDEFGRATTEDQRVALLALFKSTMDIAETTVAPEDLERFQDARLKQYKLFIGQEALVGENICIETLQAITQREIAAGRMAPDDGLRKLAEMGMAAPHLSRAKLMATAAGQVVEPTTTTDAKEHALNALDVSGYFGLNLSENFVYRLMKIFLYRREDRFARRVLEQMENSLPLGDFDRGTLLGMLDAWYMSGDMSMQMHTLLQMKIQDRKYWTEEEHEASSNPFVNTDLSQKARQAGLVRPP